MDEYDDDCKCRILLSKGPFLVAISSILVAALAIYYLYQEHRKNNPPSEQNSTAGLCGYD